MKLKLDSKMDNSDSAFSRGSGLSHAPAEESASASSSEGASLDDRVFTMPASPSYVNWEFGDGASEVKEYATRQGVKLMHDYSASLDRPDLDHDINVYAYDNIDSLADKYYSLTSGTMWEDMPKIFKWIDKAVKALDTLGLRERQPRQKSPKWAYDATSGRGTYGVTNLNNVFINPSMPDWNIFCNIRVSAHEFNHAQCNNLRTLGLDNTYARYDLPRWFDEGIADFLAYQALSESGILPYEDARENSVRSVLAEAPVPLKQMETKQGFSSEPRRYQHSMLAVEFLASHAGQSSLFEFYASLKPEISWEDQFPKTFGMSVNEFYGYFAEHTLKGFPELETPKFRGQK